MCFYFDICILSLHIVRIDIAEDQISDQKDWADCGVLLECNIKDTKSSDQHSDIYLKGIWEREQREWGGEIVK